MMGDRIPPNDEVWMLLTTLHEIVSIIFAPKIERDTISYLHGLIIIMMNDFKRIFPNIRITPKMHYMTLYPRLIEEIGPLIRHWCMRYEAKHRFFKRILAVKGNFKNVPYTMARSHQLSAATHVLDCTVFAHADGRGTKAVDIDLDDCDLFRSYHYRGIDYCENDVLPVGKDKFFLVEVVKDVDGEIEFCGEYLNTEFFSDHYRAFVVRRNLNAVSTSIEFKKLIDHYPATLIRAPLRDRSFEDGDLLVLTKYSLVDEYM